METAGFEKIPLKRFSLFHHYEKKRIPFSITFEITSRCNIQCRHCYLNKPASDSVALSNEISFKRIQQIADQAADLGIIWCSITGGEPLLRDDFADIYLYLKKKGFLVSILTNATLFNDSHMQLFKKYPPRMIEITVYGISEKTYNRVTRTKGLFHKAMGGIELALKSKNKILFKTTLMNSNKHEIVKIAEFCSSHENSAFLLNYNIHLRVDGNQTLNKIIKSERLQPEELKDISRSLTEYTSQDTFEDGIKRSHDDFFNGNLFTCNAGINSCWIDYESYACFCPLLRHDTYRYGLEKGTLLDFWENFAPKIACMSSQNEKYLKTCCSCSSRKNCYWCPAISYLENGLLD
ncbi:MAG: radical SAM protein, partial [Thermodesulfobacteriota bacterium]|nr:radical SAM protein [Thermodesulfobacteriota bacterium]